MPPEGEAHALCGFCSDVAVKVAGKTLGAHKFVLAARSDVWSLANMAAATELDLSGEPAHLPWTRTLNAQAFRVCPPVCLPLLTGSLAS